MVLLGAEVLNLQTVFKFWIPRGAIPLKFQGNGEDDIHTQLHYPRDCLQKRLSRSGPWIYSTVSHRKGSPNADRRAPENSRPWANDELDKLHHYSGPKVDLIRNTDRKL